MYFSTALEKSRTGERKMPISLPEKRKIASSAELCKINARSPGEINIANRIVGEENI